MGSQALQPRVQVAGEEVVVRAVVTVVQLVVEGNGVVGEPALDVGSVVVVVVVQESWSHPGTATFVKFK